VEGVEREREREKWEITMTGKYWEHLDHDAGFGVLMAIVILMFY